MKINAHITIGISPSLEAMQLGALTHKTGFVTEICSDKGCWVELDEPFEGEREWYIPYDSINSQK